MTLSVQRLDWDSDFFGFDVGELVGPIKSKENLTLVLAKAYERGFSLIYGRFSHDDLASCKMCLDVGGAFVDAKRTYIRQLDDEKNTNDASILEADDSQGTRQQLKLLAWQSSEYSRYRVDPKMPKDSWKKLYTAWIENSLSGELADTVLVERKDELIIGMITLGYDAEVGVIGLFCVDSLWRGQGVGRRLLANAAYVCRLNGCKQIKVVTQGLNVLACGIYERSGYQLINEQNVFHFWSK